MREQWQKLAERFGALQSRERGIVLIAAVVGTALLFDAVAFQPAQARKKAMERQLAQVREQVKAAEALMKTKETVGDSHAVKRTYRDALRGRLAEIQQNMTGLQEGMVPPERMAQLLEGVLSRIRGLQLLSLRALPPQSFTPAGAEAPPKTGKQPAQPGPSDSRRTIYRHSFEITLQGSYGDLHNYLAQLEKLPWRMFWNWLSVQVVPESGLRVTITVETLSLAKAWLVV